MATITTNTDSQGYEAGIEFASDVLLDSIISDTFLVPGVTYTEHLLEDKGQVEIAVISQATEGAVTDLNAPANTGTTSTKWEELLINKKASAKYDGTFTVAGTADKKIERAANSVKTTTMKNDYQKYVFDEIVANSTTSAVTKDPNDIEAYLVDMKTEYRKATGQTAKVGFISLDFFAEITKARVNLGTMQGDEIRVSGIDEPVKAQGLLLIPVDWLERDIILYNPAGLNIGFPVNTKSIGNGVLGDLSGSNMDFAGGLVSWTVLPSDGSLGIYTHVAMPFGVKISNSKWFYVSPEII